MLYPVRRMSDLRQGIYDDLHSKQLKDQEPANRYYGTTVGTYC